MTGIAAGFTPNMLPEFCVGLGVAKQWGVGHSDYVDRCICLPIGNRILFDKHLQYLGKKMFGVRKVVVLACSAVLVMAIGCQDESRQSRPTEAFDSPRDTYSEPPSPSEIEPASDPVAEFRVYAKTVLPSAKAAVENKRFTVTAGMLSANARFEISDDYSIDVQKSDSLISPFIGLLKLKRRLVYDELLGIKDLADPWHEVIIECGYRNGSWSTSTDLSESLLAR